jgi:hypothetical protein
MPMDDHIPGGLFFDLWGLFCQGLIFPELSIAKIFPQSKSILIRAYGPVNHLNFRDSREPEELDILIIGK